MSRNSRFNQFDRVRLQRGIEAALLTRMDPRHPGADEGRPYRSMSVLEMAREFLEVHGVDTRGLSRYELAGQALHARSSGMQTTGDFTSLLANVAAKRLRSAYEANPSSYRQWARRGPNAPDFKPMSV